MNLHDTIKQLEDALAIANERCRSLELENRTLRRDLRARITDGEVVGGQKVTPLKEQGAA